MCGNLAGGVTSSRHAEPGDLHPAGFIVCLPADVRICRNEDVIDAHIHACSGIPVQTISTLSTFTSQPFPIIVIGNQIE